MCLITSLNLPKFNALVSDDKNLDGQCSVDLKNFNKSFTAAFPSFKKLACVSDRNFAAVAWLGSSLVTIPLVPPPHLMSFWKIPLVSELISFCKVSKIFFDPP